MTFSLTTGARFPKQESPLPAESIVASGCTDARGASVAFKPWRLAPQALLLRARAPRGSAALACWVHTRDFDVRIEPPLVDVYLKEIHAPPAVLQEWERQRAAGIRWQEIYRKTARIELAHAAAAESSLAALRQPMGRGLELLPAGDAAAHTGSELTVRVLLDGKPLPNLAVEFLGERSPFGIWRTSDADGLVRSLLPFNGRWLVRATHLVRPASAQEPWRSRFATLALHSAARLN